MAFVLTFSDYRPSGRADNIKWTIASVQQASIADPTTNEPGAWSEIEAIGIPTYPDPTNPPEVSVTTALASADPGWYRLVFKDAIGGSEPTQARYYSSFVIRPSTRDVAVLIKNRTVDKFNNYVGDFTNNTIVTNDDVEEIISTAEDLVLRALDRDPNVALPSEAQSAVKDLIAILAASLVELSKFSEQVARGVSPYAQLKELFDEQLAVVQIDLGLEPSNTGAGGTAATTVWDLIRSEYGIPIYAFDNADFIETVNWYTRF